MRVLSLSTVERSECSITEAFQKEADGIDALPRPGRSSNPLRVIGCVAAEIWN
jgi:hypothetical protein